MWRITADNLMNFKKWFDVPVLEVDRFHENAELESSVEGLKFKQTK